MRSYLKGLLTRGALFYLHYNIYSGMHGLEFPEL